MQLLPRRGSGYIRPMIGKRNPLAEVEWSADALDRLGQLRAAREEIERLIDESIAECRTRAKQEHTEDVGSEKKRAETTKPIEWARIGEKLGISAEGARVRARRRSRGRQS